MDWVCKSLHNLKLKDDVKQANANWTAASRSKFVATAFYKDLWDYKHLMPDRTADEPGNLRQDKAEWLQIYWKHLPIMAECCFTLPDQALDMAVDSLLVDIDRSRMDTIIETTMDQVLQLIEDVSIITRANSDHLLRLEGMQLEACRQCRCLRSTCQAFRLALPV